MSGTVPPIPPSLGTNIEDFSSRKDRFFVYLDGLEPYLIEILKNGPFVPMSPLSTSTNQLTKPKKQWSPEDRKLANQDKRLKILAHEGPFKTRDTKIAALRLKFNAFKALEREKVNGTFTRLKCLLNDPENNGVSIPQAVDSDSDVEEDTRINNEFLADQNAEFHDWALLANQKRYYKRSGRAGSTKKPIDKTKETCFACGKLGHFQKDCPSTKTSTPSYHSSNKTYSKPKFQSNSTPQHNQSVDNHQKDYKRKYNGLEAKIAILTKKINSLSEGKSEKGLWVRKHVLDYTHVDLYYVEDQRRNLLSKFNSLNQELSSLPSNIVRALGGKGKKKDDISSKEVLFSKAAESPSETVPKTTSDSESRCGNPEPLPPLPKLIGSDWSTVKAPKKKAKTVSPSAPDPDPVKKADSSTEQLLLTLIKEVKGLKEQIKIPSDTSSSVSQSGSSKSAKGKQKTWFGPCKHYGFRNHIPEDFYMKPKYSTCGSTNHLTKEHPKQADVKKTLAKLKAQST
ncbi:retrovirus-related pol polyprotein from transposon TNT 1-94 [Tanacetum coccineum]